jgi:hypothetical protein
VRPVAQEGLLGGWLTLELSSPEAAEIVAGSRVRDPDCPRDVAWSPPKQHLELEALDQILRGVPQCRTSTIATGALLLLGVAGALRRSELVASDVPHIVTIPKSKTDRSEPVTSSRSPAATEPTCAPSAPYRPG